MDNPAYARNRAFISAWWQGRAQARQAAAPPPPPIQPVQTTGRSANPLRPVTFDSIVGQDAAKRLLTAAIRHSRDTGEPIDHVLLTGSAGTGKTTFANAVGHELARPVYQVGAPVSFDVLMQLREQMRDGDLLFVDEIHQQAILERRGKESATQPEQFLALMEDRVILTPTGPQPFPRITIIGATTDPGRLPEAFLSRFTLRPTLVDYDEADLAVIAIRNAEALGMTPTIDGAIDAALASGGTPRQVNALVKQARLFSQVLDSWTVTRVLEATGITSDGLTPDQQRMLTFTYRFGGQATREGTIYQASMQTLATALGLSRDTKAVQLYVEPLLIKRGLVQVRPGGRRLTEDGVERARKLL